MYFVWSKRGDPDPPEHPLPGSTTAQINDELDLEW